MEQGVLPGFFPKYLPMLLLIEKPVELYLLFILTDGCVEYSAESFVTNGKEILEMVKSSLVCHGYHRAFQVVANG